MNHSAGILLVDDTLENLQVLGDMLRRHGYKVRPVPSGRLAIQACEIQPPDLILLDINMPEMDGYEICKRLKANPLLAEIPVLFISAMSEPLDKVKAFGVGGVDYITKPFQIEEVEARVATHLAIRRQALELRGNYERIRVLEETRKDLNRLIVHDLRNPLNAVKGFLEEVDERNPQLDSVSLRYLRRAHAASLGLIDLANSLLDLNRMEEGGLRLRVEPVNLLELCREAVSNATLQIGARKVSVVSGEVATVAEVDRSLILRVIQNILGNALKFTDSTNGTVLLRVDSDATTAHVSIADNGPGIPEEYRGRVFDRFFQVTDRQVSGVHSTGLGLAFCKMSVEAHGGGIAVTGAPGGGSEFRFSLPIKHLPLRQPA